jgi:hypothetical protein
MPTFRKTVSSIFIGGVSRKNNWDEIVRAFIQVMVRLFGAWGSVVFKALCY